VNYDVWHYLFVFTRVSVFMAVCPVFFPTGSPKTLKAVSCLAFTLAMAPLPGFAGPEPDFLGARIAVLLREGMLGLIMGSAVQMPFAALRGAGALMDMQTGLSMAHMVDPSAGESQTALSAFMGTLSLVIFLSLDGHLWVLRGLATSFRTLPVAGPWPGMEGIGAWIGMTGLVLSTTVQAAAPIVALMLLTEFSLGIISKVLPQLNLLILGQPIRFAMGIGAAILVIGLLEPMTGRILTDFLGRWAAMIGKL
jgi:flagellar biosynthetic protein FliR